jgi:hypothetical protein
MHLAFNLLSVRRNSGRTYLNNRGAREFLRIELRPAFLDREMPFGAKRLVLRKPATFSIFATLRV